jgi:hypothetical protein
VGLFVGAGVVKDVGDEEGEVDGDDEGIVLGDDEGADVGDLDGAFVGLWVGFYQQ